MYFAMAFDQTYPGAVDWSFPSPTATPTSSSFAHSNVFQTPKTGTFPSHFQDAFSTPQVPSYNTPRQPDYAIMTPMQGQQMSLDTIRNNFYANMQAGAPGGQVMPPPGHVGYNQSAAVASPAYAQANAPHMQPAAAMSFDSSQMQTPPPTRGSSAKKSQPREVAFGTPSTIASRRFMTPQQVYNSSQNVPATQHASMQYPQLQFSPDVYQFGNFGPASAPVFPQTQLLWGATASSNMYNHQPSLDDPFAPVSSASSMNWAAAPVTVQSSGTPRNAFDTPAMGSFPVQAPMQRPVSAGHYSVGQAQSQVPAMTTASVDPSLVYSSPLRPAVQSVGRASKAPRSGASRADVKRKDSGMAERKRSETLSSTDTASSNTGLRRSSTTGIARAKATPTSESLGRSNSMLSVTRTASPLKRVGKPLLGSISETKQLRPRASVILTIDESGRASAVKKRVDDSPTKSIRDRYPGLFDSDSSEDESEDDDDDMSRSASFSFSRGEERKSKSARLDPPIENLDGLRLQRSASSASMRVTPSRASIAAVAQLRKGGSVRRTTSNRNASRRVTASSIDTCPMDTPADDRQSLADAEEFGQIPDWNPNTIQDHNRRWSIMSMEQQLSVSPTHQYSDLQYIPTLPAQPVHPTRPIRCQCGHTTDLDQTTIQCISCTQYLHTACNPIAIPGNFTCFLCTKPTSRPRPALSRTGSRMRT